MAWEDWIERAYQAVFQPHVNKCVVCYGQIHTKGLPNVCPLMLREQLLLSWLCHHCIKCIPWIEALGCAICGRSKRCADCEQQGLKRADLFINRSVVNYNHKMKKWLATYKFKGNLGYENIISNMMIHSYPTLIRSIWRPRTERATTIAIARVKRQKSNLPDLITYVPTNVTRLRLRGFNQAERLAKSLGQQWNCPVMNLLDRVQDQGTQSKHSRRGRQHLTACAFALHPAAWSNIVKIYAPHIFSFSKSSPLRLLLVDDVYTTGSTVRACVREIMTMFTHYAQPCSIVSYTWARA